jgi:predicted dehydrogenase
MSDKLNVAIIGCGDISGRHFQAFQTEAERAQITVCCDTDAERARKAVQECGNSDAAVMTDYHDLLSDRKVHAVDICLPHHLHAPVAIACAEAGKHILCEKPLALNPEECDRMIAAAKANGVTLMHLEPQRMSATIAKAAAMIREGKIGRIAGIQGTFAYWQRAELNRDWRANPAQSGGGHLMDGGIHLVDAMRHLGGEVVSVQAMTAQYRPELGPDSEDLAALNLRYAGGHCGQLFACHATRGRGASPSVTVFGTEGCLSLDAFGSGFGLVYFPVGRPHEVITSEHSGNQTYERAIRHFLDVVLNGEPLRATPEDGRENVRVVLAAYEAARNGREVLLQNDSANG